MSRSRRRPKDREWCHWCDKYRARPGRRCSACKAEYAAAKVQRAVPATDKV